MTDSSGKAMRALPLPTPGAAGGGGGQGSPHPASHTSQVRIYSLHCIDLRPLRRPP